jgi:hypothetical protein
MASRSLVLQDFSLRSPKPLASLVGSAGLNGYWRYQFASLLFMPIAGDPETYHITPWASCNKENPDMFEASLKTSIPALLDTEENDPQIIKHITRSVDVSDKLSKCNSLIRLTNTTATRGVEF